MLSQIATDIRKNSTYANTLLCACKDGNGMPHVASRDTSKTLEDPSKSTNLQQRSFTLSKIFPHSLHAGEAMTLKVADMDIVIIKKYGRCSSDTFLTCIHEKISSLRHGVSKKMTIPRDFFNIAGYEMQHSK